MLNVAGVRKLIDSWALQYLGWFAFGELVARVILEGGVVVVLWAARFPWWGILGVWLAFHTIAWLVLFGGYAKIWGVVRRKTSMERLESFRAAIVSWAERQTTFRAVYLRGSSVNREWDEFSDVDILVVPKHPWTKAMLVTWALRATWVFRRLPLEVWWVDDDRYIPYRMEDAPWRLLKAVDRTAEIAKRRATKGLLITFSGMDGSGKTTAAEAVVATMKASGLRVVYYYAHRLSYQSHGTHISLAIGFRSFWRRTGRDLKELDRHPHAKLVFDLLTVMDYTTVLWRLALMRRPNRVIVVDRYVADVMGYMRFLGPSHRLAEGILLGLSFEPDLALYFKITPEVAFTRKQEQTLEELGRFYRGYEALEHLLRLTPIDANRSQAEVQDEVRDAIRAGVSLSLPSSTPAPKEKQAGPPPNAAGET